MYSGRAIPYPCLWQQCAPGCHRLPALPPLGLSAALLLAFHTPMPPMRSPGSSADNLWRCRRDVVSLHPDPWPRDESGCVVRPRPKPGAPPWVPAGNYYTSHLGSAPHCGNLKKEPYLADESAKRPVMKCGTRSWSDDVETTNVAECNLTPRTKNPSPHRRIQCTTYLARREMGWVRWCCRVRQTGRNPG